MIDPRLARWRERADAALAHALPDPTHPPERLHAAMRHAVLLGGKRMRPLLVYAAGEAVGAESALLDAPAVAVELIHAYSLVHDDLPSMDDDALRRGQPTVHVAFDEATAVLAGDALQALAFARLAAAPAPAELRVRLVATLADAAGAAGMCGGQALDLQATGAAISPTLAELERLHAMKTGALIRAAVRMGALCGNADPAMLECLDRFAAALGLAFQVRDDILDVEGDSATLGKTPGKDAAQAKATFPGVLGMQDSRARLDQLRARMEHELASLGTRADALRSLADYTLTRTH